jgi:hypothetical protein
MQCLLDVRENIKAGDAGDARRARTKQKLRIKGCGFDYTPKIVLNTLKLPLTHSCITID